MPIFRRPSLDDRRRLVIYSQRMNDEGVGTVAPLSSSAREAKRNQAAYGSRVQRRLRARWYGVVPVKNRTLAALAAVLLSIGAVLGMLHWAALWWTPIAAYPEIARPLRLDLPGSFGTWFSAILMVATAGASFLVYQLRRYRSDDYHGHYRIWRIAIVLSLICSVDCIVDLVGWLGGIIDVLLAERDFVAGADWIRLLLGFGGAAFALRMTGEVARNRVSAAVFAGSFLCFAVPLAIHWKIIDAQPATAALIVPIFSTVGRLGVSLAVVIYLRMLYREVRRLEAGEPLVQRLKQFLRTRRDQEADVPEKTTASKRTTSKRATEKPTTGVRSGIDRTNSDRRAKTSEPVASQPQTESRPTTAESDKRRPTTTAMPKETPPQEPTEKTPDENASSKNDSKEKVSIWKRLGGRSAKTTDTPAKTTPTAEDLGEKATNKPGFFSRLGGRKSDQQAESEITAKESPAKVTKRETKTNTEAAPAETGESRPKKAGWFSGWGQKQEATENESPGSDAAPVTPVTPAAPTRQAAPTRPAAPVPPAAKVQQPAQTQNAVNSQQARMASEADEDSDDDQDDGDLADVDPDSIDWNSLSKAEKRRMRKVLKRQGKAA